MKFKFRELPNVILNLASIIFDKNRKEGTSKRRLPCDANYWLNTFLEKLQEAYQGYNTQRLALCEEFATKDADGKPIMLPYSICEKCGTEYPAGDKVKDENGKKILRTICNCGTPLATKEKYDIKDMEIFNKELEKILNDEIELPWKQIPLEKFVKKHIRCPKCNTIFEDETPEVQFDGEEMSILKYFIEEPEGMKLEKPETKETD